MEMWAAQQNKKCGNVLKQEVERNKNFVKKKSAFKLCDGVGSETVGGCLPQLVQLRDTKAVSLQDMLPLCQTL